MNKNLKAMLKISDVLDDRYKELCDRYHELELSHNRKKRALVEICRIINEDCPGYNPNPLLWWDLVFCIRRICEDALFCDGRVNERIKK